VTFVLFVVAYSGQFIKAAFDGKAGDAHNQCDSNFMTFHRFKNFWWLTMPGAMGQHTTDE